MPQVSLMLGDCLDRMKDIPAGSVDMVLCDLPYGTTACKWDSVIPFEPLWAEYRRLTKPNAAIVLTASQPFTTALIGSNLRDFRYCWVWDKQFGANFANVNRMPLKAHEDICVFYRSLPSYRPQMVERGKPLDARGWANDKKLSAVNVQGLKDQQKTSRVYTHKFPTSIITMSSVAGECNNTHRLHPTQKPVALLEYLIRTYTNEGETVLDNTMGSGSTGLACVNVARNFLGIERDPNYFAIAEQRIADAVSLRSARSGTDLLEPRLAAE